jgi:hypothetical protein
MKAELTHETLLTLLDYNPETGAFVRKAVIGSRSDCLGATVETVSECRHPARVVWLSGSRYFGSRLAWFYVHGTWPERKLYYRDGDRLNCSIGNLVQAEPRLLRRKRDKVAARTARRAGYGERASAAVKDSELRARFGIALEDYVGLLEKQRGVCAICERPETTTFRGALRRLCVDHNHETGAVRGLLCHMCNVGLGNFRDDTDLLDRATAYLRLHAQPDNVLPLRKRANSHEG